ncbi:MAG: chemotaxis protein CheW [Pseudomonas sp.]
MVRLVSTIQLDAGQQPLDDCWNRIGVRGDKSCPLLVEHVHCRNCPVYAAAAIHLLDRYALQQDDGEPSQDAPEQTPAEAGGITCSLLIFRLGEEWLGLATRTLVEVAPLCPIHALPHPRSRALLGVANVRGALVACLSLVELLGLDASAAAAERALPRMLIIAGAGGHLLVPVDEVAGIQSLDAGSMAAAAQTSGLTAGKCSRGVVQWRGRSIRLLDEEQLLLAMTRSLA